ITSGMAPATDSPGYSLAPATFLKGIYDHGGGGYFDAVGMHPYTAPHAATIEAPWSPMVQTRDAVYPTMQSHGDGAKKIWGTESGSTTAGTVGVPESQQGPNIVLMLQTWFSHNWAGPLFIYKLVDNGNDPNNWHDHFGLLTTNMQHKQGYAQVRS